VSWFRAGILLTGFLTAGPVWAAPPPAVDFLYADANEGGASGGHSAIRFDDQVFHFEYAPPVVRLRRDYFDGLRYRYTVLDNRSLLLHRVPVTPDTYQRLLEAFTRRYFDQTRALRVHAALVADRQLLEAVHARRRGQPSASPVVLEGGGFFLDVARPSAAPLDTARESGAPALASLRDRVAQAYGREFVSEAMDRILRELLELDPAAQGFAERYRDGLTALLALEVLRDARPLRADAYAGGGAGGPVLGPADLEAIATLSDALEASLVRLVHSTRPDRGFPLLVGMARLAALDESRRAGRWMFLDAFPADAVVIRPEQIARRPGTTRDLLDEAAADFAIARAQLGAHAVDGAGFPEASFAGFEAAGNRMLEISRALDGGRPMRMPFGMGVPSRSASFPELLVPAVDTEALAAAAALARERETTHEAKIRGLYGYNVVTRNCVTEIFRTIDAALASEQPAGIEAREESVRRLGGHVDVEGTLNFIPAAAAEAVQATYAVSEIIELRSYRLAALAQMYRRENPLRVYLRESNTVTSTLYQRNPDDSAFLFFTDDALPVRPILGALNLVTGLGVSAVGLFMVGVDGGDTLRAGLRGILFSLPELVFFNIRKGSIPYARRLPPPIPESTQSPTASRMDSRRGTGEER
jgi:hypothetical protein